MERKAKRVTLSPKMYLYPVPLALVGANVLGKPSWWTIATCGLMPFTPAVVNVVISRARHVNAGILQGRAFSINFPSVELVNVLGLETLESGAVLAEKPGVLDLALAGETRVPVIENCPLSFECKLVQTMEYSNDFLYTGRIVSAYAHPDVLGPDGLPDVERARPLVVHLYDGRCWSMGESVSRTGLMDKEFGIRKHG